MKTEPFHAAVVAKVSVALLIWTSMTAAVAAMEAEVKSTATEVSLDMMVPLMKVVVVVAATHHPNENTNALLQRECVRAKDERRRRRGGGRSQSALCGHLGRQKVSLTESDDVLVSVIAPTTALPPLLIGDVEIHGDKWQPHCHLYLSYGAFLVHRQYV